MADHFELATSRMVTADTLKTTIDGALAERRKTPESLTRITRLKEDLRHAQTMAKLHTGLSEVQALQDLRSEVERLFQALTAEPEPTPRGGRAPLVALPPRADG